MAVMTEHTEQVEQTDPKIAAAIDLILSLRKEEEELKARKEAANKALDALLEHRITYSTGDTNYSVSMRRDEPKPKFNLAALANTAPDIYKRCLVTREVFDMDLLRTEYAAGRISTELTELIVDGYTSPKPFPVITQLKEKK